MAVTTSKVTYSLKPQIVDRVQELSTLWGVPKSQVIQRAIENLSQENVAVKKARRTPLEALDWLQKHGISDEEARKFNAEVRRERQAWGRKRK